MSSTGLLKVSLAVSAFNAFDSPKQKFGVKNSTDFCSFKKHNPKHLIDPLHGRALHNQIWNYIDLQRYQKLEMPSHLHLKTERRADFFFVINANSV